MGFWGSLIATVGVVLPAYLVIIAIVAVLKKAFQNQFVQAVLRGLKPCVIGIVLATGVFMVVHNMFSAFCIDIPAIVITSLLVGIMFLYPKLTEKKLSPILLICISGILGIVVYSL